EVSPDDLHRRIGALVAQREIDAATTQPRAEAVMKQRVVVVAEHEHRCATAELEEAVVRRLNLLPTQRLACGWWGRVKRGDHELATSVTLADVDADEPLPRPIEDGIMQRLLELEGRAPELLK